MTTFRNIEKKMTAAGWVRVRSQGSHFQYKHMENPNTIVIPNHGSKDLSIGVIKNLEKMTGLSLRR